jgi:hypothetical protein
MAAGGETGILGVRFFLESDAEKGYKKIDSWMA